MSKLCDECETVAHCMKHGCIPKQQALDKMAENARELGLDYEPAQKPVTPCTHPSLGFSSLREDGAASRWSCVMCGTEFVPKATQRWTEFNETTKRNIEHAEWYLSTHPQPAQQEPVAYLVDGDLYYPEEIDWESLQEQGHTVASLYTQAQRTWVGLEKSDMPDGADPLFDDPKFIAGMVYAANKLMEKNT